MEEYVQFIGAYCDDEIIVFCEQRSNKCLNNLVRTFQGEVGRLLGIVDIQFTMEVWRPGQQLTMILNSEVYRKRRGIRTS